SKGAHTVAEALVLLKQRGISVQASFAGDNFQAGYREFLEQQLAAAGLDGVVQFVGKLTRKQLARFFLLHQVCVFPSIHPEAFGIVGAEAMASGLALITSGVGGAAELIENGVSGLRFNPGDAGSLARCLEKLLHKPSLLSQLRKRGEEHSRKLFSVEISAKQLESLFISSQNNQPGFSTRAASLGSTTF
ncbi:MAG: glycosyltransferase, partial [Betaproteobacteria bacterium]|nr:glycosyltransferase [Betaproteobacteria bacterium]